MAKLVKAARARAHMYREILGMGRQSVIRPGVMDREKVSIHLSGVGTKSERVSERERERETKYPLLTTLRFS